MKLFELQTPISRLKSLLFLRVDFFQIGCSEQSNKTHNFRKSFTLEFYCSLFIILHSYTVCITLQQRYLSINKLKRMFEKDIQFFHHCHPECIGHEIQGKYNYIPTLPEVFSSELDQKQASHCNLQPVIHVQYGEISR